MGTSTRYTREMHKLNANKRESENFGKSSMMVVIYAIWDTKSNVRDRQVSPGRCIIIYRYVEVLCASKAHQASIKTDDDGVNASHAYYGVFIQLSSPYVFY